MSEPAYGSPDPAPDPSLLHEPPATTRPFAVPPEVSPTPAEPPASYGWGGNDGPPGGYVPATATADFRALLTTPSERGWAVAAHLSALVASVVALGFIGPLAILFLGGGRSAYVRRHAVEALNFNLSVLAWAIISGVLVLFFLVGIPMLIGLGIIYVISTVRGAVAAGQGRDFRYPLTVRFVR